MKEGMKSVGTNGKQNSMFPMDVMNVTQGEGDSYSHGSAKAIDYTRRDKSGVKTNNAWYYAPADITVLQKGSAGTIWVTDNEVNTPIGTTKLVYMFWHDDNHANYTVGMKRKQGEKCGQTGNAGNSTADHLHIEVMKGSTFDKSNAIHNWDAFFINDTEIVNDRGYKWVTTNDSTGIDDGSCVPPSNSGNGSFQLNDKVNAKVRSYEPMMKAECERQGIPDATIPLLALMMVESGGEGGDPMQSSESAGLPMNTIKDPHASIVQGVKHFKESMQTTAEFGCDLWTIFQQYNYGIGYARYVGARGKVHTMELSMEYSRTVVAPSLGNTTGEKISYRNEISIASGFPWRYKDGGNFHYSNMIKYYTTGDGSINSCGGSTEEGQTTEDKEKKKLNDYIKQLISNQVNGWATLDRYKDKF